MHRRASTFKRRRGVSVGGADNHESATMLGMLRSVLGRDRRGSARSRYRPGLVVGVVSTVAEVSALWMRTGRLGGNVVVGCRRGHRYMTIWIPGISLKSVRLGWW